MTACRAIAPRRWGDRCDGVGTALRTEGELQGEAVGSAMRTNVGPTWGTEEGDDKVVGSASRTK